MDYFTVKCLFWETVSHLSVACWPTDNQQLAEESSSQLPKHGQFQPPDIQRIIFIKFVKKILLNDKSFLFVFPTCSE